MAAVPMSPLVGNDCALYYNSATYDTPTWVEVDEAGEVNLAEWNVSEAEVVTRASDWAVALAAKFRAAVEFQYLWGANWTVLNWLRQAFMARTRMDILYLDGPVTAADPFAQGLRMPVQIRQFPINQANEEVVQVDTVRMTPCYANDTEGNRIVPYWVNTPAVTTPVTLRRRTIPPSTRPCPTRTWTPTARPTRNRPV